MNDTGWRDSGGGRPKLGLCRDARKGRRLTSVAKLETLFRMLQPLLRRFAAALFMAGLALGPARAAQGSPVDPVKAVYALLEAGTTGKHEVWFRPPHRDRLLTRRLAALFATDDRYMEESGDQGS